MSSKRRYLLTAGRIFILLIVLIGALQSGKPASYADPYGFLFILAGGAALLMVSFPGKEILRALRQAARTSGTEDEIRSAAHFWEAAGRNFWILGGLSSVLSLIIGFVGLRTVEVASISALIPMLIRPMLSTLYGIFLAVICFVPCWKLLAILRPVSLAVNPEPSQSQRPDWRFGKVLGYAVFLAVLIWTSHTLLNLSAIWPVYRPALLVVLGGTLALILFMGKSNTRLTPSSAFAGMGLIGAMMGFIQMLHGMTISGPQGIGHVAGAVAFVLFSCLTALLGMAVIGAPMEDRAIRSGVAGSLSAFSRVSWYVFPLLSLIFVIVVFINIIIPLPAGRS